MSMMYDEVVVVFGIVLCIVFMSILVLFVFYWGFGMVFCGFVNYFCVEINCWLCLYFEVVVEGEVSLYGYLCGVFENDMVIWIKE